MDPTKISTKFLNVNIGKGGKIGFLKNPKFQDENENFLYTKVGGEGGGGEAEMQGMFSQEGCVLHTVSVLYLFLFF